MPTPSFPEWLASRSEDPPQADRLATIIGQAGAAGVSIDRLRTLCELQPETLADVLKALVTTGQVTVLKINGQLMYRATT